MNILAVDTAFEYLGICLIKENQPLANYYALCKRRNAKIMFNVLDGLLLNANMKLDEIDLYVVTQGPGSYTGIRIGMSMIKGFAQIYQKPVIGVNSLHLLASMVTPVDHPFQVLLNCTRSEVFYASFQYIDEYTIQQLTPIHLTTLEKLFEEIEGQPVMLKRTPSMVMSQSTLFEQLKKLPLRYPFPDAYQLQQLGKRYYLQSNGDDLPIVHPLYIKKDA